MPTWKKHLDKIGIAGSFITAACCMGIPAIVSIITAIGLGFLIHDAILLPLLVVFLTATLVGLAFGYRVHRRPWALALGSANAAALFFFIFVHTVKAAAYLAIGGLIFASALNVLLSRNRASDGLIK